MAGAAPSPGNLEDFPTDFSAYYRLGKAVIHQPSIAENM